jgi:folate-binding protein YgfZ
VGGVYRPGGGGVAPPLPSGVARVSPLRARHEKAGAVTIPYGPPEAGVALVASLAEIELEYAAIRKHAALLDEPHRGTLEVVGADRADFLNRMVTQDLRGLRQGQVRRGFWLNRKGRIDADLRLIELGGRTLVDVDVLAAERTLRGLSGYVITEDVSISDAGERVHRLALHGPDAPAILARVAGPDGGAAVGGLDEGRAVELTLAGQPGVVFRDDWCGEVGLELIVPARGVADVYAALLEFAHDPWASPDPGAARAGPRLRPVGWHAFNIARIEAGTPLYHVDFGPDSLPHETGVLRDRVSFTKGCYVGQEVVARMESRGHSKRTLVGLRCDPVPPGDAPEGFSPLSGPQPVSGSPVYPDDAPHGEPVGIVTSSTPSPMLSLTTICFAAVKPGYTAPGTRLNLEAEGDRRAATVQPSLTFYRRGPATAATSSGGAGT